MDEVTIVNRGEGDKKANAERSRLVKAAGKGDKAACRELYAMMDADGSAESFVHSITNTAFQVRTTTHEHGVIEEAFRRKMKQMREELGWEAATALERLLIERIVLCWHHLHQVESSYANALKGSMSLDKGAYYQKGLDRAQGRYVQAIQSLATVRRLQLPAVQVNIGEKQVNLVQAAGVPVSAALPTPGGEGP